MFNPIEDDNELRLFDMFNWKFLGQCVYTKILTITKINAYYPKKH